MNVEFSDEDRYRIGRYFNLERGTKVSNADIVQLAASRLSHPYFEVFLGEMVLRSIESQPDSPPNQHTEG